MTNQQKIDTVKSALSRRLAELINRSSEDGYDPKYATGIEGPITQKGLPAVEAYWNAQMADAIEAVGGGVRVRVDMVGSKLGPALHANVVEVTE